jgi:hypothetical protein
VLLPLGHPSLPANKTANSFGNGFFRWQHETYVNRIF